MSCEDILLDDVAEKYVAGRLPDDVRGTFEAHYFACDACFAQVEALQAAKRALLSPSATAPKTRTWLWTLPVAALLLTGVFLWPHKRAEVPMSLPVAVAQPASKDYSALARFEPPPWPEARYRSASSISAQVEHARSLYAAHRYAACAESLAAAPRSPANLYYHGICLLLAGRNSEGVTALRDTIAAGDTSFLEEAHFYLARALLVNNGVTEARKELTQVVAMHGDLETQADSLLKSLH